MRILGLCAAVALIAGAPETARAYVNLTTDGGFLFDIYEYKGSLNNGTSDAYDGCYTLYVDGSSYTNSGRSYTTSMSGRQVELPEVAMGSLMVRRLIYVPMSGGDWARYVDVLRNPGTTDVTATVRIYCNLGSDSSTVITGTASGDTTVGTDDRWVATDDSRDGSGDPSLAHVIFDDGALVAPTSIIVRTLAGDIEWSMSVTVPAGGQAAVMTFAVQTMNRAGSIAEAERLVTLPSDALAGIDALLPDVVNFPIGGAPIIRLTGPTTADEGESLSFDVEVTDLEGDTATWAWDIDGDGVYSEFADETRYTLPAGMTDGDSTFTVGVEASDGTASRQRSFTVEIANVEPTITSVPPTPMLYIGSSYVYDVVVDDPAGAADPITYTLVTAPDGMVVDSSGRITWTPARDQRGMSFSVELGVDDGDGGTATQTWDLTVANNRRPTPPTPVSPIDREIVEGTLPTLVVANGSDPDGDELLYYFRVDRSSSFGTPAVQRSPALVEMAEQTAWTVPVTLADGVWYWEAWVSDGLLESDHRYATFVVGVPSAGGDAGAGGGGDAGIGGGGDAGIGGGGGTRRDRGGCAASGEGASALPWLLVPFAVLLRRRRLRPRA